MNGVPVCSLTDPAATEAAGAALAMAWRRAGAPRCLVALEGELGAGKTTYVRGVLRALGEPGPVRSPTYTLLESYTPADGLRVHHLDCYRLGDPQALEELDFRELVAERALILIEWASRIAGLSARADLAVLLEVDAAGRRLTLEPHGELGARLLAGLPAMGT